MREEGRVLIQNNHNTASEADNYLFRQLTRRNARDLVVLQSRCGDRFVSRVGVKAVNYEESD